MTTQAHNEKVPAFEVRYDFDYQHGGFKTGKHAADAKQWLENHGLTIALEDGGDQFRLYDLTRDGYFWPMGTNELAWQAELANL